jgi:ribosomal protein S18 acetylase RimI-like enzyme
MSKRNLLVQVRAKSGLSRADGAIGCEHRGRSRRTLPMETSQAGNLAAVVGRAIRDAPHFKYMLPDERLRHRLVPGFCRTAVRASQLYGEIHSTPGQDGGALWIRPGTGLTIGRIMRMGFASIPFHWEWACLRRCMNLGACLDKVHRQLIESPHWYLLAVGIEPSKESGMIGRTLFEPLLSRADSEGLPCYVETFNEEDLTFYRRSGFRIAAAGKIARGGPDFWTMIRAPQTSPWKSRRSPGFQRDAL